MEEAGGDRRLSVSGLAALVGGVMLAVGSLLPWFRLAIAHGIQATDSASGIHFVAGVCALATGIIAAAAGLVMLMAPGRMRGRGLAIVTLVAAAVGMLLVVVDIFNETLVLDNLVRSAIGHGVTDAEIEVVKRTLGVTVSLGMGIFVSAVGGIVALIGGIVGVGPRRPSTAGTADA